MCVRACGWGKMANRGCCISDVPLYHIEMSTVCLFVFIKLTKRWLSAKLMNACDAGHLTPSTNTKQTKKNCLLIINDGDLMMIRKKTNKKHFPF